MERFYPAINEFVQNVLPLLVTLVATVVAIVRAGGLDWLKANTNSVTYKFITGVVDDAVAYAANYYKSANGQLKKQKAIEYAQSIFSNLKIPVDAPTLANWIEAAYSKRQDTERYVDNGGQLILEDKSPSSG